MTPAPKSTSASTAGGTVAITRRSLATPRVLQSGDRPEAHARLHRPATAGRRRLGTAADG
jgi:hypothetical protein